MSPRGQEQNEHMRRDALEKVTKAALKVFAEYGYYGATMKKITDASELSYGLVYHYFTSKEEVFLYLVNLALEKTQAIFERALIKKGTAWEKLTSLSRDLLEESLAGDAVLFFHIMLQALTQSKNISGLKENIDRNSELIYEKIIPVVIEAQAAGDAAPDDPKALVTAFSSLVQGLALFTFQDETIIKSVTPDVLLNVLRK